MFPIQVLTFSRFKYSTDSHVLLSKSLRISITANELPPNMLNRGLCSVFSHCNGGIKFATLCTPKGAFCLPILEGKPTSFVEPCKTLILTSLKTLLNCSIVIQMFCPWALRTRPATLARFSCELVISQILIITPISKTTAEAGLSQQEVDILSFEAKINDNWADFPVSQTNIRRLQAANKSRRINL